MSEQPKRKFFSARNVKIMIASGLFVLVFGLLYNYNYQVVQNITGTNNSNNAKTINQTTGTSNETSTTETTTTTQNPNSNISLYIYGNVQYPVYITFDTLLGSYFIRQENEQFYLLNVVHNSYNTLYSGVELWSIFQTLNLLTNSSTYVQFIGSDGYYSDELPISVIQQYPEATLICTQENGQLIPVKSAGGDGPIESAVNFYALFKIILKF